MRPLDLLPVDEPKTTSPPPESFYFNVSKWLIPDIIRIMNNGIPIDLKKVKQLEETVDETLLNVERTLAKNKYIQEYLAIRRSNNKEQLKSEVSEKMKDYTDFIKPFNPSDMTHRSFYVKQVIGYVETGDFVLPGIPKWSVKDLKTYQSVNNCDFTDLINKEPNPEIVRMAMVDMAKTKASIYNKQYQAKLKHTDHFIPIEQFNASSSDQKHELLTGLLGLQSDKLTDAYIKYERECKKHESRGYDPDEIKPPKNKYSWNRDNLEKQLKLTDDPELQSLLQALIDYSFGAIIKSNFIPSFYNYTIDGTLYGNLKLAGTKTFRLTSNNPNMLQMPSTGSIYSKPVKECLVAPEGYVILAIDYGALENRVIANLSKDENLSNIYLQGLDGHCMNSLYYFREEINKYIELTGNAIKDTKNYYDAIEQGNKELKAIRQKGKGPSFGMQYGAFPPKIAESIKCSLEEAEQIFNRYHNELYPGVTKFREEYVEPTVKRDKRIHGGLGFYLNTDSPSSDIRTLVNFCSQFWSILTLLSINEVHHRIDQANAQDHIKCIATIYDSIYYICKKDAGTIKFLNDNIVECMTKPFIKNQIVPNEATAEIGLNWASLKQIPNGATESQIQEVLQCL